jgi:CRP/FNR family transcriptional regulator
MNKLFFHLFSQRYAELLDTIGMVLFNKMDQRLYEYLLKKSRLAQNRFIKTSHRQIASELGTAREVVTRVMKKLEMEGKVIQHASGIEIVER